MICVSFTSDGRHIVSASNGDHHEIHGNTRFHVVGTDNSIRVWSVDRGEEVRKWTMTEGRRYGPRGMCLSPDGALLAVSSGWVWANGPSEPRVYVWDLVSGERKHHFVAPGNHAIRSVTFMPGGSRISVVRSGFGGINSWSLPDAAALPNVALEAVPRGIEAPKMTWSPDGRFVLSAVWGGSGDFIAWDSTTGKIAKTFRGHAKPPTEIRMSSDGKRLLSCSQDYSVRLWDWESASELFRLGDLDSSNVECVAFSRDGSRFLAGADHGAVTLHNASTGDELARFAGHEGKVRDLAFSPTGLHAVSGGDDATVRLWRLPQ